MSSIVWNQKMSLKYKIKLTMKIRIVIGLDKSDQFKNCSYYMESDLFLTQTYDPISEQKVWYGKSEAIK